MNARVALAVCIASSLLALPLFVELSLVTPAGGRLHAQEAQNPPTFRGGANYVRVDVYATADGKPVTDLQATDFTVLEDGARQQIDRFEYVNVRDGGPAPAILEPGTVAESRQPSADGRVRLLVLFLDRPHVDDKGSATIRQPLLNALARSIGDRDLVAVMTPDMTPLDLAFTTKTTALERFIERDRYWGERSRLAPVDRFETQLQRCYGGAFPSDLLLELIARRRETRTFDALSSLVEYLGNGREGRKAILLFSSGWLRYTSTDKFARLGPPMLATATGSAIGAGAARLEDNAAFRKECDVERVRLGAIDHDREMRTIMERANRSNTSFYPIDPRGVAVFDNPDAALQATGSDVKDQATADKDPVIKDQRNLQQRLGALRELAEETDGLAVVNTNSLDAGLRRVVDDLSSYYLLSYASSGKLDGKFHSITVRSSRPGVSIRARRGFLSPKLGDLPVAASTASAAPTSSNAVADATRSSLANLAGAVRDLPVRTHVVASWSTRGTTVVPSFTIVGEIADRTQGATLDVTVAREDGTPIGTAGGRIAPGATSVILTVAADGLQAPGAFVARIRIQSDGASETFRVPITLPAAPQGSGALYFRRGQATGNRDVATADLRFRRGDQLRIEVPGGLKVAPAPTTPEVTVRLLDRNGNPMSVPVEAGSRTADDGSTWMTAKPAMASLAAGDYVVELSTGSTRLLAPFRVVP